VKWLRLYSEVLDDPKIQRLPVDLRWRWIELLCLANSSEPRGYLPSVIDISFRLRLPEAKTADVLKGLIAAGLLEGPMDHLRPHSWDQRQPVSDNAAERMNNRRKGAAHQPNMFGTETEHVPPRVEESRSEEEKTRQEGEESDRAPAHPFAFLYAQNYRSHHNVSAIPPAVHGIALALETEYGADLCIEVAIEKGWDKHPNYYRNAIKERRNGNGNGAARGDEEPRAHPEGVGDRVHGLDRRSAFVAEQRRRREQEGG
jgi:hypothetical protein